MQQRRIVQEWQDTLGHMFLLLMDFHFLLQGDKIQYFKVSRVEFLLTLEIIVNFIVDLWQVFRRELTFQLQILSVEKALIHVILLTSARITSRIAIKTEITFIREASSESRTCS